MYSKRQTFNSRKDCLTSSPRKKDISILPHVMLSCPSRPLLRGRGPWVLSLLVFGHGYELRL